jgi:hypothetical protein
MGAAPRGFSGAVETWTNGAGYSMIDWADPCRIASKTMMALGTCVARTPVDQIGLKNKSLSRADRVGLDIDACFDRATRAVAPGRVPAEPERRSSTIS